MMIEQDTAPIEDHRSVTGRRRREAMRTRILTAAGDLMADHSKVSITIEDVAQLAGISRGAFYKHFTSLDEALAAIGREAADGMTLHILPVYDVLEQPLQRISTAMRLFLMRAHGDQRWARFFLRAELIPHQSILLDYVFADLERGQAAGQLDLPSLQAGVDSLIGATLEGIRSLTQRGIEDPVGYIDAVIVMVLRGFGVADGAARQAVDFSRRHSEEHLANQAMK